jgi:hypothetical protein
MSNIVAHPSVPFINNRNNFLISKVPSYHPTSKKYLDYWRLHKKRCMEGFWSADDIDVDINVDEEFPKDVTTNKWRYMPANLYFYVNFGTILHKPEDAPKTSPKQKIRPLLRDTEWSIFYIWAVCRGFSGFEDDDEYTCNRDILNENQKRFHKSCYKKDGSFKTYMDPVPYLNRVFDKPLGKPVYENMALDFFWLACRGVGKSFSVGVGIVLHELLFDGAKFYTEAFLKNPPKAEIFVGAAISSKSADILKKTKEGLEELPGSYIDSDGNYYPPPFSKTMSGSLQPNNMKNPWRNEYDKKVGGTWKTAGTGSNVKHGLYTTENPEAAAGGRYSVAVVEEWGLLGNSLRVHGSNTATLMDYPVKFGSSVWIGTGGNVEKIQETEIMFRDPAGFDALEFDDVWEGSGKIGYFLPAYYGMNDYKDEQGNTKLEEAIDFVLKRRDLKKKSKDSSALDLEMMNYPLVPSEVFLNKKGNRFPIADLKEQLRNVEQNPAEYSDKHWYGELIQTSKGIEFEPKDKNNVCHKYPIKNNAVHPGTIEFFEMPKRNQQNEVYANRYLLGTDTYDDDDSNTNSLGSIFVMDGWTKRVVAEYTGRRSTKEFYEITRRLTIFYNGVNNYENNKKGLFWHYEKKKTLNRLADTPQLLKDEANISIRSTGNTRKGTPATTGVNKFALDCIVEWLDEDLTNGEEYHTNVQGVRSVGLLKELIAFNPENNFDRVSALGMLLILVEDRYQQIKTSKSNGSGKRQKTLADDDFFSKNYKNKSSSNSGAFRGLNFN